MQQDSSTQEGSHHIDSTTNNSDVLSFTAEEELLFDTRYAEGYNLYDPRYIAWLKVVHPEESCKNFVSLIDHFPDATSPEVVPVLSDAALGGSTPNLLSEVTDQVSQLQNSPGDAIAGLTPIRANNTSVPTRLYASPLAPNLKSSNAPTSINNPATSSRIADNTLTVNLITADISTASSSTTNISTPSSSTVNISTPSSSTAFNSTPNSSTADNISPPSLAMVVNNAPAPISQAAVNNTSTSSSKSPTAIPHSSNMISKYLIQYVPAIVEKKKTASTRVTGLRVLTSAEGLAILTEKEEKMKQEKEEKEKRKQERIDKRRKKQELAKKKAEEKAAKSRNVT